MKNKMQELAETVGFVIVNTEDNYIKYEFNERVSGVEVFSHIVKVDNVLSTEKRLLTFNAVIGVLPKKLRKRINKLINKDDVCKDDKSIELAIFAINEFKAKSDYSKLKEYGELLGVDIEKLGFEFSYDLSKKQYSKIISIIEQAVPIEHAVEVGKIKKIDYKIGYIKSIKLDKQKI